MPTGCRAEQLEFEGAGGRRVITDFAGGAMTSDAGTLLLRHGDRTSGLIDRVTMKDADRLIAHLDIL